MRMKNTFNSFIQRVIGAIRPRSAASIPQNGEASTSRGLIVPLEEMGKRFTLGAMAPRSDESRYFLGPDDIVQAASFRFR